jgi:hypothetical protein
MNSNRNATAFMYEDVVFKFRQTKSHESNQVKLQSALRNSSGLYYYNKYNRAGWPNEGCWQRSGRTDCMAIGITPEPASVNQFCSTIGNGFKPVGVKSAKPSFGGWGNNGKDYYNLRVARFTGSQWVNICQGGLDCHYKESTFVSDATCRRDL